MPPPASLTLFLIFLHLTITTSSSTPILLPPHPPPPSSTGWESALRNLQSSPPRLCGYSKISLNSDNYGCIVLCPVGTSWNATSTKYFYYPFQYKVDQNMAVLKIQSSFQNLTSPTSPISTLYGGTVGLFVILQNRASFIRTYYDDIEGRVYPSNTIVADVDRGIVQGVAWDKNCNMCSFNNDQCNMNSYNFFGNKTGTAGMTDGCYLPLATCKSRGSGACDINIYVSMYGTDANGKYLQSANARQSTFKAYDNEATNWLPSN